METIHGQLKDAIREIVVSRKIASASERGASKEKKKGSLNELNTLAYDL